MNPNLVGMEAGRHQLWVGFGVPAGPIFLLVH
jgi:hypothetical protein